MLVDKIDRLTLLRPAAAALTIPPGWTSVDLRGAVSALGASVLFSCWPPEDDWEPVRGL